MDTKVLAISIFALVYLLIIAGENSPRKLDRPAAGLIGAVLVVICGVLSRRAAIHSIDFSTLALLLGMMIVIHYARLSGLLDHAAAAIVARSGTPRRLLWNVCLASGVLSALFVNDTICLLMTPLVLRATRRMGLPAEPYLLAVATSSNAGSMMTITGNPQNMLIGQTSGWHWGAFAVRMIPVGLVCLALNALVVDRLYRGTLHGKSTALRLSELELESTPLDRRLATKTLLVFAGMLAAFLAGAPLDLVALSAAAAIMVLANHPAEEAFESLDWSLLLFFAGLFVVVAGVASTEGALIGRILPLAARHGGGLSEIGAFSLLSVVGSNLFSNVPFVLLLRGVVKAAAHAPLLWLALSASSTLAGNLTMAGSVANLIVAQGSREECPLSFMAFLRVGLITTAVTVAASVLMLWGYAALHWV